MGQIGNFLICNSWAPGNASSSCGLWPIIGVGKQIDLLKEALTTHRIAHFVIRLDKQLIICWSLEFPPGSFGSASCSRLDDHCFIDWWAGASSRFSDQVKMRVNSIIILGSWLVWKHRNYCVFDGGTLICPGWCQPLEKMSSSGL